MYSPIAVAPRKIWLPSWTHRAVTAGIKAHGLVLLIAVLYFSSMAVTVWGRQGAIDVPFQKIVGVILEISISLATLVVAVRCFWHTIKARPESPIAHFTTDFAAEFFDTRRWATGLPMAFAILLFMYSYAIFKYNIPVIAPFSWDETLEYWGRAVHFGLHPWQWLYPVLSNVPCTVLLSANYILWTALVWIMVVALGFSGRNDEIRTRFFLTFMLTWSFGGTLVAILFSSAGPCFWQRLHLPGNPYGGIMDNLQRVNAIIPLGVVDEQDLLWTGYSKHTLIAGISAMPSMHNATALLLALTSRHLGRTMAILLWCHCGLTFVGSIWLGWHYSVDCYAAFVITSCFWWLSKPVAAWWHQLDFVREFDFLLASLPGKDSRCTHAVR